MPDDGARSHIFFSGAGSEVINSDVGEKVAQKQ